MGLLDGGIRDLFGSIFGQFYLAGVLHKATLTDDGQGGFTETVTDYDIKYQRDDRSDYAKAVMRVPDTDVSVLILQAGMTVEPTTDDRFTIAGGTFVVVSAQQDPAGSYWRVRGSPSAVQE